ncbi:RDD family protein [Streptomyces sp. NPDC049687]|uniref:RDD family protein n=1 Tax=Streptomyces sp. NPDC049687 TaxID=3365596 RepID=UPI00379F3E22
MSAPTPAPGDDRPREGYYPDPSIPGYVRYWNGSAWVPGTSRPAPSDGTPLTPPASPVEETGPHFFDEDPDPAQQVGGGRPEPASAWGADRSHQSGFGGDPDRRVSWGATPGSPATGQPGVPGQQPGPGRPVAPVQPDGRSASTDGTATIPPAEPEPGAGSGAGDVSGGTFVFRRPTAADAGSGAPGGTGSGPDPGTVTFRAPNPRTGDQPGAFGSSGAAPAPADPAVAKPGFAAGRAAAERAAAAQGTPGFQSTPGPQNLPGLQGPAPQSPAPQGPAGFPPAAGQAAALSGPQQAPPGVPPQGAQAQAAAQASAPMAAGPGGGQSSWAQQVHRLAGADEAPVPWKPPVEDIFQAAARRQAAARPAALGKRFAARLVDTLVLATVTSAAAVPLGLKAADHVNEKIDEAKLTGQTVTVWLLDGTTSVYLGIVLAVLLVFGIVYEVLPTAKWGRTLGKKLLGLEVRDIEAHEPPSFGAALRRWLVYSVPGLLVIGVVGVVWGVFDKPWHQCWHDKAAHTFVAG